MNVEPLYLADGFLGFPTIAPAHLLFILRLRIRMFCSDPDRFFPEGSDVG